MLANVFSFTSTEWTTPAFWAALSLAAVSLFSVITFKLTRSSVAFAWAKTDKRAAVEEMMKNEHIERIIAIEESSDISAETPSWLNAITDEKDILAGRLSSLPGKAPAPQENLTSEGRRWLEMVENVNPRLNHNAANQPIA